MAEAEIIGTLNYLRICFLRYSTQRKDEADKKEYCLNKRDCRTEVDYYVVHVGYSSVVCEGTSFEIRSELQCLVLVSIAFSTYTFLAKAR